MIYGRFHDEVTILRLATLGDVWKYERRQWDAKDKAAIEKGAYVVTRAADGFETLSHIAYLRADGSLAEIQEAIAKATSNQPTNA